MKKLIIFLMFAVAGFTAAAQYDDYGTYRDDRYYYDEEFDWHWDVRVRITDGIKSGLITTWEANRLYKKLERVEQKEYAYMADGNFTDWEQNDVWSDVVWLNRQVGIQLYDGDRNYYGFNRVYIGFNTYPFWYNRFYTNGWNYNRFDRLGWGSYRYGYAPRNYYPRTKVYVYNNRGNNRNYNNNSRGYAKPGSRDYGNNNNRQGNNNTRNYGSRDERGSFDRNNNGTRSNPSNIDRSAGTTNRNNNNGTYTKPGSRPSTGNSTNRDFGSNSSRNQSYTPPANRNMGSSSSRSDRSFGNSSSSSSRSSGSYQRSAPAARQSSPARSSGNSSTRSGSSNSRSSSGSHSSSNGGAKRGSRN